MKRVSKVGALLFALALVAAACGSDDADTTVPAAATTTTAAPGAVPDLVEEGKLILVTTGNFPPFTKINESTGDNEGYSVDIAKEIARRLGTLFVWTGPGGTILSDVPCRPQASGGELVDHRS